MSWNIKIKCYNISSLIIILSILNCVLAHWKYLLNITINPLIILLKPQLVSCWVPITWWSGCIFSVTACGCKSMLQGFTQNLKKLFCECWNRHCLAAHKIHEMWDEYLLLFFGLFLFFIFNVFFYARRNNLSEYFMVFSKYLIVEVLYILQSFDHYTFD